MLECRFNPIESRAKDDVDVGLKFPRDRVVSARERRAAILDRATVVTDLRHRSSRTVPDRDRRKRCCEKERKGNRKIATRVRKGLRRRKSIYELLRLSRRYPCFVKFR